jgi:hypothetical protein
MASQKQQSPAARRVGDAPSRAFRGSAEDEYYYRRQLERPELLSAVGVGIGVGVAAFYVARVLMQRTPLDRPRRGKGTRRR